MLRIDAVLVDAIVDKSDWLVPGKVTYRGNGAVSLVVVLRDSETGESLYSVDLPLRIGSLAFARESPVNYWGYLRLIFDRIAARVGWALDDAPSSSSS